MRVGLILTVMLSLSAVSSAREIHMLVNGNDSNDGQSNASAVATLQRAMNLAIADASAGGAAEISIGEGRYVQQMAVVSGPIERGSITLRRRVGVKLGDVVFTGAGAEQTWLLYRGMRAGRTALTIKGLVIENYGTAISLESGREDPKYGNNGTVIEENIFRKIGSTDPDPKNAVPTAAIRLLNSSENKIVGNSFEGIRNARQCTALHSIYVAHFSSRNIIRGNSFSDVCGSAIKLRDRANDNIISENSFSKLERVPAVEEWFCDKESQGNCTKVSGECPSTGNILAGNVLDRSPRSSLLRVDGGQTFRSWCSTADFTSQRARIEPP